MAAQRNRIEMYVRSRVCGVMALALICLLSTGCMQTQLKESVVSQPAGARVFAGPAADELADTGWVTPHERTGQGQFWPRWYYQVRKEGYKPSDVQVKDRVYGDRTVSFTLEPIAGHPLHRARFGYIRLTANIASAQVSVDGKQSGALQTGVYVAKLKTGQHTLRLSRSGYIAQTIKLSLDENQVVHRHIVFAPSPKPAKRAAGKAVGSLSLLTARSNLRVKVGGVSVSPPITLDAIAAGEYELEVTSPSGTKSLKREVRGGQTVVLDLDTLLE